MLKCEQAAEELATGLASDADTLKASRGVIVAGMSAVQQREVEVERNYDAASRAATAEAERLVAEVRRQSEAVQEALLACKQAKLAALHSQGDGLKQVCARVCGWEGGRVWKCHCRVVVCVVVCGCGAVTSRLCAWYS